MNRRGCTPTRGSGCQTLNQYRAVEFWSERERPHSERLRKAPSLSQGESEEVVAAGAVHGGADEVRGAAQVSAQYGSEGP